MLRHTPSKVYKGRQNGGPIVILDGASMYRSKQIQDQRQAFLTDVFSMQYDQRIFVKINPGKVSRGSVCTLCGREARRRISTFTLSGIVPKGQELQE